MGVIIMKKIDKDGLVLCELQAKAFELSSEKIESSSAIFIRRFMNSEVARNMDSDDFLHFNIGAKNMLDRINEEYGVSQYGSEKYTKDELYWMGYIYRYFAYTYDISSKQVYKIIKSKELRNLFLAYHTMDPKEAIARILEAKGINVDKKDDILWQYEIFRRIRKGELV